ncbi:MAG: hypothetical protein Q7T36_00950 [Fluviicoccus sp.]|uniref:hypothetical protein n=1 Tax=Fluviicoccus sp. TaxID=2003552 RepID=UPI00271B0470|nr:hypothetical protein [Fluviicoccus sp.]MDO8329021.1 hypothetical protein [Fluviicoccus sp.]
MNIDGFLKIFQSVFYITASIVAVLTYVKAKNGLLNTVNTEYHKKVIERLSQLSDELYKEFDSEADDFWVNEDPIKEILEILHIKIAPNKEKIISSGILKTGIPVSKKESYLQNAADKYKSDPFIPESVRLKVVDLLEARSLAFHNATTDAIGYYTDGLSKGKFWDTLETNHHWLHNRVLNRLYEMGCGVSQVNEEVHEIRLEIQKYFSKFNPTSNR